MKKFVILLPLLLIFTHCSTMRYLSKAKDYENRKDYLNAAVYYTLAVGDYTMNVSEYEDKIVDIYKKMNSSILMFPKFLGEVILKISDMKKLKEVPEDIGSKAYDTISNLVKDWLSLVKKKITG